MISFDTNIVAHSANADAPENERARAFISELAEVDVDEAAGFGDTDKAASHASH